MTTTLGPSPKPSGTSALTQRKLAFPAYGQKCSPKLDFPAPSPKDKTAKANSKEKLKANKHTNTKTATINSKTNTQTGAKSKAIHVLPKPRPPPTDSFRNTKQFFFWFVTRAQPAEFFFEFCTLFGCITSFARWQPLHDQGTSNLHFCKFDTPTKIRTRYLEVCNQLR
jgi:hypothetical protein